MRNLFMRLAVAGALLCSLASAGMAQSGIPPTEDVSDATAAGSAGIGKAYSVGGALRISEGNVSYTISNANRTVSATVARLSNYSSTRTSGTIKVILFVTTAPITGTFTYWTVGEQQLDPLPPNYEYTNLTGTVPLKTVPDGVYYIHIGAFEYEGTSGCSSGYCLDDFVTFSKQVQVSGGIYTDAGLDVVTSVEYYHSGFGHYFVSGVPEEIAALDSGSFAGWARTGQTFKVWSASATGRSGVCRFFTTAFSPKSSHFYTPNAMECAVVQGNPVWQFEGVIAHVVLPSASGACSTGIPLYRLYNNGKSGAPNHRYTTSTTIRSQMISQGWIPEGAGTLGVIACVPT